MAMKSNFLSVRLTDGLAYAIIGAFLARLDGQNIEGELPIMVLLTLLRAGVSFTRLIGESQSIVYSLPLE